MFQENKRNYIYIWISHPLVPRCDGDACASVHRILRRLFQLDFYANSLPASASCSHKWTDSEPSACKYVIPSVKALSLMRIFYFFYPLSGAHPRAGVCRRAAADKHDKSKTNERMSNSKNNRPTKWKQTEENVFDSFRRSRKACLTYVN